MRSKPLAIDLFCGLGGWTEGLIAEGFRVVGFDIERHVYGDARYPAQLVLQDVLTIHGSQFKDAALIVASPPCQEYSYMAMPWTKAKDKLRDYQNGSRDRAQLTALFDTCFRIQREACEAAGRYIPLVVENVRGAQPWVGRAKWHFGSFYLWGDVPALMPITMKRVKNGGNFHRNGSGVWNRGEHIGEAVKVPTTRRTDVGNGVRFTSRDCGIEGIKGASAGWFNDAKRNGGGETGHLSRSGSKSSARKAASAQIAKIPLVLARHVARAWHPDPC